MAIAIGILVLARFIGEGINLICPSVTIGIGTADLAAQIRGPMHIWAIVGHETVRIVTVAIAISIFVL
jgi:hypothetical protein